MSAENDPKPASGLLPPIEVALTGQGTDAPAADSSLPFGPPREKRRRAFQPAQEWLIPYENPLLTQLGKEFFAAIPRTPGVYFMHGRENTLLYVGKAKNLRSRLFSYKNARPDAVSRKVIRMLNVVERIEYEECASEEAALLRENSLLREHRPPFNVVNTSPETYYLVGLTFRDTQAGEAEAVGMREIRFQLTTNPGIDAEDLYGAFKGRGSVREGYAALLRLLWLSQAKTLDRFGLPSQLTRYNPPLSYHLRMSDAVGAPPGGWRTLIERFLRGTSLALLQHLTERMLENESIHPFHYKCIQDDLESARRFYEFGPHRNRKLRRHHNRGPKDAFIAQAEIDDLIVTYRLRSSA